MAAAPSVPIFSRNLTLTIVTLRGSFEPCCVVSITKASDTFKTTPPYSVRPLTI